MRIYDLTQRLSTDTPVYPGDEGVEIRVIDTAAPPTASVPRRLNNSRLSLGVHNGTHIDSCFHFFSNAPTIDQVHLQQCCGPANVVDVSSTVKPGFIDACDLTPLAEQLTKRPILLLHTGWHRHWQQDNYFTDHPKITGAAASLLVECGIKLVGVDTPSVDQDPFEAHLALLGNNVLIVENLTGLDAIVDRDVDFFALPLPIVGRDASPVRAIAIERMAGNETTR